MGDINAGSRHKAAGNWATCVRIPFYFCSLAVALAVYRGEIKMQTGEQTSQWSVKMLFAGSSDTLIRQM